MFDEHIAKLYEKGIKSQIKEDQYAGLPKWAYTPEEVIAMLDKIKDEIEDRLYKISDGSTYLDIEREFVRDEIFKIIDGHAESEVEDGE